MQQPHHRVARQHNRWSAFESPTMLAAQRRRELYESALTRRPDLGHPRRPASRARRGAQIARHMALAIWSLLAR